MKVFIGSYRADSWLKIISRLHGGLEEIKLSTSCIKQKWERETTCCIAEEVCSKWCDFRRGISSLTWWRTFGWRSLSRFSLTCLEISSLRLFQLLEERWLCYSCVCASLCRVPLLCLSLSSSTLWLLMRSTCPDWGASKHLCRHQKTAGVRLSWFYIFICILC